MGETIEGVDSSGMSHLIVSIALPVVAVTKHEMREGKNKDGTQTLKNSSAYSPSILN